MAAALAPFVAQPPIVAAQDVECRLGGEYIVAVKPHEDEPGALMAVTAFAGRAAPQACAFDAAAADLVIGAPGDPL